MLLATLASSILSYLLAMRREMELNLSSGAEKRKDPSFFPPHLSRGKKRENFPPSCSARAFPYHTACDISRGLVDFLHRFCDFYEGSVFWRIIACSHSHRHCGITVLTRLISFCQIEMAPSLSSPAFPFQPNCT